MASRLRSRDALFLSEETAHEPRHVATLAILDPGPDGFDYDNLVRSISDRIALVPRYRQRVRTVPANLGTPLWVDDEKFDLTFHVRRSALPRPGSMVQLRELVARLLGRRLDRERPLWEAYLVEGLAGGRVALLIKSHQALVDGTNTVDLAQVLLEDTDKVREIPEDDWVPEQRLSPAGLLTGSLAHTARHPATLLGLAEAGLTAMGSRLPILRYRGLPAHSALTASLSQQRRFVTLHTPLEDYRRVRDGHGGTVNDVILAVIAGGVRGWLMTRAEPLSPSTRISTMVPMSVTFDGEQEPTSVGSHVTGQLLSLPVGEANPVMRLHQVSYALKAHRETGRAVAASDMATLPGFAPTTFHALGARVAQEQSHHGYTFMITNVPGPQEPLFIAGTLMVETYPALPISDNRAVAVGVTSYNGGVFVGIVADRDAVPDADVLGQCMRESLEELVDTLGPSRTRAPRGRKRPDRSGSTQ